MSMDPLRTEQDFQELKEVLVGLASVRWRLMALGRFLDELDVEDPSSEAYLLDLAEPLAALMRRLEPVGLDPEACARLVRRFEQVVSLHPDLEEIESLVFALQSLREAAATLYAYVGDLSEVFATITPRSPAIEAEGLSPLERLEQAARQARIHHHPAAPTVEQIATIWRGHLRPTRDSAVVPVAERALFESSADAYIGGLRRVQVDVYGERLEGDDVTADVTVFGAEEASNEALAVPVQAARALLAETYPSLARRYVGGRVRFSEAGQLHTGRSSDLAVAAVFYGAVLRYAEQRRRYEVAPGTALTGLLDEEGRVLPVDTGSLETKVRTAFFSWVRCLAVPKVQVSQAETICQGLAETYPRRRLDVMGIGHLRDVFYDRRLSTYRESGRIPHAARWAWQRKFSVGGLAVILILLVVIGRLLYGPLDKNPVTGEYVSEMLVVRNAAGQTLEEIPVGEVTVRYAISHAASTLTAFADATGDGRNEIFWIENQEAGTPSSNVIRCKESGADTLLWSRALQYRLDFPSHPEIGDDLYRVQMLAVEDVDDDGAFDLIATLNHYAYFPSLVIRYDAATGQEQGRYAHLGWFRTMTLVDLNEDGKEELVLGGINNALDKTPVLAVLDPSRLSGQGPGHPSYAITGMERAHEVAYVRFPISLVSKESLHPAPTVGRLTVQSDTRRLVAEVAEGRLDKKSILLLAHFSFDLKPTDVGTGDSYDIRARQLVEEGRLDRMPDSTYWQAYMSEIQYWDGDEWRNEPVVHWPDEATESENQQPLP